MSEEQTAPILAIEPYVLPSTDTFLQTNRLLRPKKVISFTRRNQPIRRCRTEAKVADADDDMTNCAVPKKRIYRRRRSRVFTFGRPVSSVQPVETNIRASTQLTDNGNSPANNDKFQIDTNLLRRFKVPLDAFHDDEGNIQCNDKVLHGLVACPAPDFASFFQHVQTQVHNKVIDGTLGTIFMGIIASCAQNSALHAFERKCEVGYIRDVIDMLNLTLAVHTPLDHILQMYLVDGVNFAQHFLSAIGNVHVFSGAKLLDVIIEQTLKSMYPDKLVRVCLTVDPIPSCKQITTEYFDAFAKFFSLLFPECLTYYGHLALFARQSTISLIRSWQQSFNAATDEYSDVHESLGDIEKLRVRVLKLYGTICPKDAFKYSRMLQSVAEVPADRL